MVGGHTNGFDYSISIAQIEIWIVSLLGVPHALSEDDVYKGFFILKGPFHFSRRFFPSIIFCQSIGLKESIIAANAWYVGHLSNSIYLDLDINLRCFREILHDPEIYPEPEEFKPKRFLDNDGSFWDDPTLTLAFGVGKRICPGRHFVDATLFVTIRPRCRVNSNSGFVFSCWSGWYRWGLIVSND